MLSDHFRARVDELLREQGRTRSDLARALRVDPANVTRRLNGQKAIDLSDVEAIGAVLGVRFDLVELPADAARPEMLSETRAELLHAFLVALATMNDADALWLLRALERIGP